VIERHTIQEITRIIVVVVVAVFVVFVPPLDDYAPASRDSFSGRQFCAIEFVIVVVLYTMDAAAAGGPLPQLLLLIGCVLCAA